MTLFLFTKNNLFDGTLPNLVRVNLKINRILTAAKGLYNGDKVADFAIVFLSTSSGAIAAAKAGPGAAEPFGMITISVHRGGVAHHFALP